MIFKKQELKLLWPFYLEGFISKIFFILPAFMILYFNSIGLSMFETSILLAVWPLSTLIFEIPTGAVADLYGRKFSVLLGVFLQAIGLLFLYFINNYIGILLILAFIGASSTLVSGASGAWVTDLINKKSKSLLQGYYAKYMSLTSLGFIISGLIGAIIVKQFGLNSIWFITSISFFISFVFLLFGEEYHKKRKTHIKKSFKEINKKTKSSIKYSYKHKPLFYLLIAGTMLAFIGSFNTMISWTPLMKNLGYPDYAFGYFMSAIAIIGVIAPLVGNKLGRAGGLKFIKYKLSKNNKERKFIFLSLIGLMIFILLIIFANNLLIAFIVILGTNFFLNMMGPSEGVYFQRFIPTKMRATINSIDSMLISLIAILAFPIAGFLVDNIGAKYTIFISGFFIIPALFIYYKMKKFD